MSGLSGSTALSVTKNLSFPAFLPFLACQTIWIEEEVFARKGFTFSSPVHESAVNAADTAFGIADELSRGFEKSTFPKRSKMAFNQTLKLSPTSKF